MSRKRTSPKGDQQLPLPFNDNSSMDQRTDQDNIVLLSVKISEKNNVQERESRQRSINRILNYADKLKW